MASGPCFYPVVQALQAGRFLFMCFCTGKTPQRDGTLYIKEVYSDGKADDGGAAVCKEAVCGLCRADGGSSGAEWLAAPSGGSGKTAGLGASLAGGCMRAAYPARAALGLVPGDGPEFEKGHYGPEYSPIDHHLNSGQRGLPSGTAVHLRTGGTRLGVPAVSPSLWGGGAAL